MGAAQDEVVSGPYTIDWSREDLERVRRTIAKKYNAEIHAQSAIDSALELRRRLDFRAETMAKVEIDIFDVAHRIIGSGEEGERTCVEIATISIFFEMPSTSRCVRGCRRHNRRPCAVPA
jgi:2-methylcitrate dehydratase PrpD